MNITARPYQLEAVEVVKAARARGITRQLVSMPVGSGKTVAFATLAKDLNCRTLIIAHREELIRQASDKFQICWPEASVGIVMADSDEVHAQVVIASIQTACREKRLAALKACSFQLMVVDEAHHAVSDSYRSVIEELGFMGSDPSKLLVGVTATPGRGDKQTLGGVFQEVVFERSISAMIKGGYLSDIKGKRVLTKTSLSGVHTRAGDFIESELSEIINTPQRNNLVVEGYQEYATGRKAVAFCCDVAHSKDLKEAFQDAGIAAAAVYGDMEKDERRDILSRFSKGELQVVCNCQILTEGYDEPSISCILMARPTKSLGLYTQCIGRGTRLFPGKSDCLVIDYTDSSHDINSIATLEKAVSLPQDEAKTDGDKDGFVRE